MFSIPWLAARILTAVAVFGLVACTAHKLGVGSAIAIWFVLPPGLLVGWLGVAAAVSAASTLAFLEMERRSATMRASMPEMGWGSGRTDIHAFMRLQLARRNEQIREERRAKQAALVRRDQELERMHAARRSVVQHGPQAAPASRHRGSTTALLERIPEATGPDERIIMRLPVETPAPPPHLVVEHTLPRITSSATIARRTA